MTKMAQCQPAKIAAAAIIWPKIFWPGLRSKISSITPTKQAIVAPASMPSIIRNALEKYSSPVDAVNPHQHPDRKADKYPHPAKIRHRLLVRLDGIVRLIDNPEFDRDLLAQPRRRKRTNKRT